MNRVFTELSEREDEVAQMIGSGLEAKEVAESCFKSVATIRNQMQSIYEKLSVRNRSELSIKMMERIFNVRLSDKKTNAQPTHKKDEDPTTNERLLSIIESQQRTIENLSKK
jgi:DNA-binding CsgD family transcriptional regulator